MLKEWYKKLEIIIVFENELVKNSFLKHSRCESIEELKQLIKTNNLIENVAIFEEARTTYCFVLTDEENKEYKFYSDCGNMEIDQYDSEGTGRFKEITGKSFEFALKEFNHNLEDLSSEVMVVIQY